MTMECEERVFKDKDGNEQTVWIPVDEQGKPVEKTKFWERHPVAKKVAIGVGIAIVTGGIGLVVKAIVDARTEESGYHTEETKSGSAE